LFTETNTEYGIQISINLTGSSDRVVHVPTIVFIQRRKFNCIHWFIEL